MLRLANTSLYGVTIEGLDAADNAMATAADKLVAEVRRTYNAANTKVNAGSWFSLSSSSTDAAKAAMRELGPKIDTWATTYRRWAEAGKRDDGTKYTWSEWVKYGQQLLQTPKTHAGVAWDANIVNAAVTTAKQTVVTVAQGVETVAKTAADIATSPWTKIFLLGGGALVGLYFVTKLFPKGLQSRPPPPPQLDARSPASKLPEKLRERLATVASRAAQALKS